LIQLTTAKKLARHHPHLERRTARMSDLAGEPGRDAEQCAHPGRRGGGGCDPSAALGPEAIGAEQDRDRTQRRHHRSGGHGRGKDEAKADASDRTREHHQQDPRIPAFPKRRHPDDVLRDQDRQQDRRRLDRIIGAERHQRGAERAETGKAALGETDQDDGGNGEQEEVEIEAQPGAPGGCG
jgi:hypothetical protein